MHFISIFFEIRKEEGLLLLHLAKNSHATFHLKVRPHQLKTIQCVRRGSKRPLHKKTGLTRALAPTTKFAICIDLLAFEKRRLFYLLFILEDLKLCLGWDLNPGP